MSTISASKKFFGINGYRKRNDVFKIENTTPSHLQRTKNEAVERIGSWGFNWCKLVLRQPPEFFTYRIVLLPSTKILHVIHQKKKERILQTGNQDFLESFEVDFFWFSIWFWYFRLTLPGSLNLVLHRLKLYSASVETLRCYSWGVPWKDLKLWAKKRHEWTFEKPWHIDLKIKKTWT